MSLNLAIETIMFWSFRTRARLHVLWNTQALASAQKVMSVEGIVGVLFVGLFVGGIACDDIAGPLREVSVACVDQYGDKLLQVWVVRAGLFRSVIRGHVIPTTVERVVV